MNRKNWGKLLRASRGSWFLQSGGGSVAVQIIYPEDVPEHLSGSVYSWKVSLHIPGLNLILCGDKKWFPSKSHISYFFLHFFFPQMIWQFQPLLANWCISAWNKAGNGTLLRLLQMTLLLAVIPLPLHSTLGSSGVFVSRALKLGWWGRAAQGGRNVGLEGFVIRSSGVCYFHPLPPHLPLHKTTLPRRVKGHFLNTITKLLGSIPRGRWIAQQKQID